MIKILKVEGRDVKFLTEELITIPQFRELIDNREDKYKEYLIFLWYSCDWLSPYVSDGLPEDLVIYNAVNECGIDHKDFILDDLLKSAMSKYKDLQNVASLKLLNSLLRTLYSTNNTINFVSDYMNEQLQKLQSPISKATVAEVNANEDGFDLGVDVSKPVNPYDEQHKEEAIKKLMAQITSINAVAKTVPDTIDKIEKLKIKVSTELSDKKRKSGGQEIGNRELPGYAGRIEKFVDDTEKGLEIKIEKVDLSGLADEILLKTKD